jgi:hypothetical protein
VDKRGCEAAFWRRWAGSGRGRGRATAEIAPWGHNVGGPGKVVMVGGRGLKRTHVGSQTHTRTTAAAEVAVVAAIAAATAANP